MKKHILILAMLSILANAQNSSFRRTFNSPIDSVEVVLLKVEFQKEDPDNSLTTGNGQFDSDADTLDADYSLDPQGKRKTAAYWQKHFAYVNDYFKTASKGKLKIGLKVFPAADDSAYRVPLEIIDYNRTQRNKDEKLAAFDSSRIASYMKFAQDAIRSADTSKVSPFANLAPTISGVHRIYMVIHAGASRMLDGGGLGTRGADTPGDFIDAYLNKGDYAFLRDFDSTRSKDTLGIALNYPAIDTLTDLIILSETHSQDNLNWGTNGMLIHLLGRALGMPITYNASSGISRLGYFDLMDFAGANAGNGFFPVLPSAWQRLYMGWDEAIEIKAGKNGTFELSATGLNSGDAIYKIPLGGGEYLLLENRQRSKDNSGLISLYNDKGDSVVVPIDSLHLVFQDSICDPEKDCVVNKRKASGILTGASHYDLGLPGSGIAVWHVNDWIVQQTLNFDYLNSEQGELGNDFHGLYLLEADGVPNLGVEVNTGIGRNSYDYGSGADLYPHQIKDKEKKWIYKLDSKGYSSTQSWSGGYTQLKLEFEVDSAARIEQNFRQSKGDSILNIASPMLKFSVDWGGIRPVGGKFPVYTGDVSSITALVPQGGEILFFDVKGNLRWLDSLGGDRGDLDIRILQQVVPNENTYLLDDKSLSQYDTLNAKAIAVKNDLQSLAYSQGHLFLGQKDLLSDFTINVDSAKITLVDSAVANDLTKVLFSNNLKALTKTGLQYKDSVDKTLSSKEQLNSFASTLGGETYAISGSVLFKVTTDSLATIDYSDYDGFVNDIHRANAEWQIALTDIDRSGSLNVVLVSEFGEVLVIDVDNKKVVFHYSYLKTSGPPEFALGDIDNDGYVNIAFVVDGGLLVLDHYGIPLANFPFAFREQSTAIKMQDIGKRGFLFSPPLFFDVNGDDKAEVVIANTMGLLHAVDGQGREASAKDSGIESWPLSIGGARFAQDTIGSAPILALGPLNKGLRLFVNSNKELNAFDLKTANTKAAHWTQPSGNLRRNRFFDVNVLKDPNSINANAKIEELYIYPNPVLSKNAHLHFNLGAHAKKAEVRIFDVTGAQVFKQSLNDLPQGPTRIQNIALGELGSATYKLYFEVEFANGKKKTKWFRFAVVR